MIVQFFRDLFSTDSSSSTLDASSSTADMSFASSDVNDCHSFDDSASSNTRDPSPFDGWGCGSSNVQCLADCGSITPSFSETTTYTWGSIDCGSSSSSSGFDW
jgi:hypothetical protein